MSDQACDTSADSTCPYVKPCPVHQPGSGVVVDVSGLTSEQARILIVASALGLRGESVDADAIVHPDWQSAGKCHDWRNHVDDEFKAAWSRLSIDAKIVAYVMAEDLAWAEEWE